LSVFLLTAGSSKKNDLLAEQLGRQRSEVFFSSSGIDPTRELMVRSPSMDFKNSRLFSDFQHTFFHMVPFEVKDNQPLFRLLNLERRLYHYVQNTSADAIGSDAVEQAVAEPSSRLYAVKIPDALQSYDEIVVWMEGIPSAIICFDGGGPHPIHDPLSRIILDELSEGERRFAFLGDSLTVQDESLLRDILASCGYDTEIFVADGPEFEWQLYDLSHTVTPALSRTSYASWLQYLDSFDGLQNGSDTVFSKLELQPGSGDYHGIRLSDFLRTPINDLSCLANPENRLQASATSSFEDVLWFLIEMGFGEASLSSRGKSFSGYNQAMLSFISHILSSGIDASLIFSSFFSGIPASYQKKILDLLYDRSGVFLIVDDPYAISEYVASVSEKIQISNSKNFKIHSDFQVGASNKEVPSSLTPGKVYLLSEAEFFQHDFKEKLFLPLQESGSVSSFLYLDFLHDERRNNILSTFGTFSGILHEIREVYARHPLSLVKGFTRQHYSYLSHEGRCPVCSGRGSMDDDMVTTQRCYFCKGGRLDPERNTILIEGCSFHDVFMCPLNELSAFFSSRMRLGDFYSACEDLDLLHLSLGDPVHLLHYSEYKKIFLIKLMNRFKRKSQCIILDGFFRGVGLGEAQACVPFIKKCCDEGALLIVRDTAHYLEKMIGNTVSLPRIMNDAGCAGLR
jgi:hypothetical protein